MTNYLNEAAYRRWLRQYQIHMGNYIDRLNRLRLELDDLPKEDGADEGTALIEAAIEAIDVQVDRIVARDFSEGANPLSDSEIFWENLKVLSNLIVNLFKRPDPFMSIYEIEKNKIMQVHREFKFKEKLLALKDMIDALKTAETAKTADIEQTAAIETA